MMCVDWLRLKLGFTWIDIIEIQIFLKKLRIIKKAQVLNGVAW